MEKTKKREIDPQWWRPFFEGAFGQLQIDGIKDADAPHEADLLLEWLDLKPRAKILDAPTGAGRIALELARRGFELTGVDFNSRVIDKAKEAATEQSLKIDFGIADIRQLAFTNEFDAAISWWSSYGYFESDDNAAYLAGLARALRPGGKLVLDTLVAETHYQLFAERGWQEWNTEAGLVRLLEHRAFDLETGRLETEWTFLSKNGEHRHLSSIYLPTYRELVGALKDLGLGEFSAYERPSGAAFRLGSPRLCLVATKQ